MSRREFDRLRQCEEFYFFGLCPSSVELSSYYYSSKDITFQCILWKITSLGRDCGTHVPCLFLVHRQTYLHVCFETLFLFKHFMCINYFTFFCCHLKVIPCICFHVRAYPVRQAEKGGGEVWGRRSE